MRILVDTNVVLDYLTGREPFSEDAFSIIKLCAEEHVEASLAAHTIVDLFFLLHKDLPAPRRRQVLQRVCSIFIVVGIDDLKLQAGLENDEFSDFEDCLQMECAKEFGADYIVTRNIRDYKNSAITAIEPKDFLKIV